MQDQLDHDIAIEALDHDAVRAHLAQLLTSRYFSASKRLRSFLTYVVDKELSGQGGDLKEYVIATEVYERGPDYDPQIDSTVRVEASRLRAKLREYYAGEGASAALRIELPKGSYVPVFTSVAKPEVEVEPAAAVKDAEEDVTDLRNVALPLPGYLHHKFAYVIAATLFCAALITWRSVASASEATVAPVAYDRSETTPPGILEQYLEADRLLRQRALSNGWSGEVPPNVVRSIALFEEVTAKAPNYAKAWVGLGEAQEWAYEIDRNHPIARLESARTAVEHAIAVDPKLGDAHSRLAAIYLYSYGDLQKAEESTRRAIAINPRDIRSQARYIDLLRMQNRLPEALAAAKQALAFDATSARLWSQQALVLYDMDRIPEAMAAADHALELNPGNQMNQIAMAHWILGLCLQRQGMLERAEAEFRAGLAVAPQDDRNQPALGFVLARQGKTSQAREVLSALTRQQSRGKQVCYGIALVHLGLGEGDEAKRWFERSAQQRETTYRFLALDKRVSLS